MWQPARRPPRPVPRYRKRIANAKQPAECAARIRAVRAIRDGRSGGLLDLGEAYALNHRRRG